MQCQVLHDLPRQSFDALLYPQQNPINQQYILNNLNQYSQILTDQGRHYFNQAQELYNQIHDSEIARKAKAALRMARGVTKPNVIMELNSFEELRSAQPIMQRYIMAEPTLRKLYQDQRCDGYSDSYYDAFPNTIGRDHYDYRRVMSGMVQDIDDGESWKVSMFTQDTMPGDPEELTFENKIDIIPTWDLVRIAIEAGEDISDIKGGRL